MTRRGRKRKSISESNNRRKSRSRGRITKKEGRKNNMKIKLEISWTQMSHGHL